MLMRRRYVLSTVVVALALWPEAAADATWQGKPGRLAYSNGGGIHTIGGHGRHHHLLAERGGGYGVAWSRKGRHLAYSTGSTLWVARADGSKRELVVSSDGRATVLRSPSWA